MNFRELECFFAVADELHFGRAAFGLHVTQASVSEAVARLERSLGAPLFERTSRRVALTEFGRFYLGSMRPAFDGLQAAHRAAVLHSHRSSEIHVGHTPELGHLLFPRLAEMIAGQEDAVVRPWKPFLMHTHEQLAALRAGAIDIAVCWQPDANESLERNVLARCPFVAVMRLDDPLARLHRVRVCDLQGRQLVISPRADNRFIDSRVEKALADAGISTGSLSEVSRYDELGVHVAARSVVALHPASIVVLNRVPGLTFAEIVDDGMYLDISAVTRRDSRDTDDLVELLRGVALSALDEVLEALHRDVTTVDG